MSLKIRHKSWSWWTSEFWNQHLSIPFHTHLTRKLIVLRVVDNDNDYHPDYHHHCNIPFRKPLQSTNKKEKCCMTEKEKSFWFSGTFQFQLKIKDNQVRESGSWIACFTANKQHSLLLASSLCFLLLLHAMKNLHICIIIILSIVNIKLSLS